ncbi:hypothetical protein E3P89_01177 [Wallemia ichthyophaga]|uniref:Uricase n=1 Tax=Wallemia ichthyophaga TaxID=245174 RepID=A0A4T0IAL4_WALIC|nr:hypothetical protein E3P90_01578 [Wallemia ichthyophaga]TIB15235.1 hypothetical protein E3P93_01328 [Wallemia ichthyophaga]TIB24027.1 hypothetical protein E3P89_01177 [Wallemia ichthyophaga]TIB25377.1 hypothetical protein E3P88_01532 [Wallemia ichthyophaga]
MTSKLTTAKYGKDGVKLLRILRNGDWHDIAEYTVTVLLQGDIHTSYTSSDNSVIVSTDSIKNTINILAQNSQHVLQPECFALEIALHFLSTYAHINKAEVCVVKHRWTRICPSSSVQPHGHSFRRDGDDKRTASVLVDATVSSDTPSIELKAGLKDVLLLKSTGSSFANFIIDSFTTLKETDDRVFSTVVDCSYTLNAPQNVSECFALASAFDEIAQGVRDITLDTFALEFSESVQATLFSMAQKIVEYHQLVDNVNYNLPNKHYIPIDLSFYQMSVGMTNDVLLPTELPSGLICGSVSRL